MSLSGLPNLSAPGLSILGFLTTFLQGSTTIAKSDFLTPELKVVAHRPVRRVLLITGIVLFSVLCVILGFALGQNKVIADRVSSGLLTRDLNVASDQIQDLEAELVEARLALEVQSNAADALRENMQTMHTDAQRLREEVTFYKSLMAPGEVQEGLKIAELELRKEAGAAKYQFELLLTQVALRRRFISGDVRVDVIGTGEQGETSAQVVKSLTELGFTDNYPLRFKFRYFQDLKGEFELPRGFEPDRVLVTTVLKTRDPNMPETTQESFPWPQDA